MQLNGVAPLPEFVDPLILFQSHFLESCFAYNSLCKKISIIYLLL